jgi:hypothetical protein
MQRIYMDLYVSEHPQRLTGEFGERATAKAKRSRTISVLPVIVAIQQFVRTIAWPDHGCLPALSEQHSSLQVNTVQTAAVLPLTFFVSPHHSAARFDVEFSKSMYQQRVVK